MTTPIAEVAPPLKLLVPEAAMATRIIRNGDFPHDMLQWLALPSEDKACPKEYVDPALAVSIRELLNPLLESASSWEKQQTTHAAPWLSAILRCISDQSRMLRLGITPRLLASNLLPLYRTLATGKLHEGFEQSRHRLFETVSVITLCKQLDGDMVQFFDQLMPSECSPHSAFSDRLDLNLVAIGKLVRNLVNGFEQPHGEFNSDSTTLALDLVPEEIATKYARTVDWADPELLWRLGGELLAKEGSLVLPRAWIDTPIPWSSISEHWQSLWYILSLDKRNRTSRNTSSQPSPSRLAEGMIELSADSHAAKTMDAGDREADFDHHSHVSDAKNFAKAQKALPKVLIAEVLSHNDPAYVSVIRRQLTVCRAESRVISIASILVTTDENAGDKTTSKPGGAGLQAWQKKLVDHVAEHPEAHEALAFLTTGGELLLCILDLDRIDLTGLVRNGLAHALGTPDSDASLTKVRLPPACYFAGIAAISKQRAGITPEDFIQASRRCLAAASTQRQATIKSIEVY